MKVAIMKIESKLLGVFLDKGSKEQFLLLQDMSEEQPEVSSLDSEMEGGLLFALLTSISYLTSSQSTLKLSHC